MELEIESYRLFLGLTRPTKWIVTGRNSNFEEWKIIEMREHTFITIAMTFKCQTTGTFNQFKFQLIGRNRIGSYQFDLNSIELFGTLHEFKYQKYLREN